MKKKRKVNKPTVEFSKFEFACFKTDMTPMEIFLYSYIRNWNITKGKPVNNFSSVIASDFNRSTRQIDKILNQLYKKGWVQSSFTNGKRQLTACNLTTKMPLI